MLNVVCAGPGEFGEFGATDMQRFGGAFTLPLHSPRQAPYESDWRTQDVAIFKNRLRASLSTTR